MRTGLTPLQTNIIDADVKTEVSWLFEIDRTGNGSVDDYWSTKAKTWAGQAYTFKVTDFSPIRMERNRSELGMLAPSSFRFTITNKNNTLTPANFSGGNVTVRLVAAADLSLRANPGDLIASSDITFETFTEAEAELLTWNFDIVGVSPGYQTLTFECRDWLKKYIEDGYWPNTPLVHHLWPTNEGFDYDYCVPVVFGTVYTPIPSAFISTDRFYILGPDAPTYTLTKARNPTQGFGTKVEWLPASFTFTQSTKTVGGVSYKALQVIGADTDANGTADANVTFKQGDMFLPLNVKMSRSDLASTTNPADLIEYILLDFGIPSAKIDSTSQDAAAAIYTGWGLTFNAAFVRQEDRQTILTRLLRMAHLELIVRDKIYFKVHSKASKAGLEKNWVLDGSFRSSALTPSRSDSGYVLYPHVSGDVPVTNMVKTLVPAKATKAIPSTIQVEAYYVYGSANAQRIGILDLQRQILADKEVTFTTKGKALYLEPDDVMTVNAADYGAGTGNEYNILIDSIEIDKDLAVDFSCTGFSAALDDWADLSPTAVTVAEDNTLESYQPITVGPDSTPNADGTPNLLPGRLRIGAGTSFILLEPADPLRISVYAAGTEKARMGNLNGFLGYASDLYGIAIGEATKYLKYDGTNGLRIAGDITATSGYFQTVTLGKTGVASGTLTLQLNAGGGNTYIAAGKTDFTNTDAGFILGLDDSDSDKAKLYIGSSTYYLNWDGANLTINGFLAMPLLSLQGAFTDNHKSYDMGTGVETMFAPGSAGGGSVTWPNTYQVNIFSGTNPAAGSSAEIVLDKPSMFTGGGFIAGLHYSRSGAATNILAHLGIGRADGSNKFVGFKFNETGSIYAVTRNGASESTTELSGTPSNDTYFTLMAYETGGNVFFYQNAVLKATHTTNIPTTAEDRHRFHCLVASASGATGSLEIVIKEMKLWGPFPSSSFGGGRVIA